MSMTCQMRRVSNDELQRLETEQYSFTASFPEATEESEYERGARLDLEKDWHAIHFTLSGQAWDGAMPLGFLLGGTPVSEDFGYGPIRILEPHEVRLVAAALEPLTLEEFRGRLDPPNLQANEIYPDIWDRNDPEDANMVALSYEALRNFVLEARASDEYILLLII